MQELTTDDDARADREELKSLTEQAARIRRRLQAQAPQLRTPPLQAAPVLQPELHRQPQCMAAELQHVQVQVQVARIHRRLQAQAPQLRIPPLRAAPVLQPELHGQPQCVAADLQDVQVRVLVLVPSPPQCEQPPPPELPPEPRQLHSGGQPRPPPEQPPPTKPLPEPPPPSLTPRVPAELQSVQVQVQVPSPLQAQRIRGLCAPPVPSLPPPPSRAADAYERPPPLALPPEPEPHRSRRRACRRQPCHRQDHRRLHRHRHRPRRQLVAPSCTQYRSKTYGTRSQRCNFTTSTARPKSMACKLLSASVLRVAEATGTSLSPARPCRHQPGSSVPTIRSDKMLLKTFGLPIYSLDGCGCPGCVRGDVTFSTSARIFVTSISHSRV